MDEECDTLCEDTKLLICSASKCPSTSKVEGKSFFKFPENFEWCCRWVKKAGNIDILSYKPSELAENFYLCSNHFSGAQLESSNKQLNEYVPPFFACDPLTDEQMKTFLENAKKENYSGALTLKTLSRNKPKGQKSSSNTDCASSVDIDQQKEMNQDKETDIQDVPTLEETARRSDDCLKKQTEDEESSKSGSDVGESHSKLASKKIKPKISKPNPRKRPRPSPRRCTPSRKAKDEAVTKLSNQQKQISGDDGAEDSGDEPFRKMSKTEIVSKNVVSKLGNPITHPIQTSLCTDIEKKNDSTKPIDEIANECFKKSFSQRTVDILNEKPADMEERKSEIELSNNGGNLKIVEVRNLTTNSTSTANALPSGNARTISYEKKKSVLQLSENGKDLRVSNLNSELTYKKPLSPVKALLINRDNSVNADLISDKTYKQLVSPVKKAISIDRNNFGNKLCDPVKNCNAFDLGGTSSNEAHSRDSNDLVPFSQTVATQTEKCFNGREIVKILDCDKKLFVMSGIPSFEVLDSLSDATLKMVMNNTALINDMEPTLREWIVMTCTKFMLSISFEALSVMFEMSEDESQRIVEKTCLFLRKTLSLPECQKYIWSLPSEILDGIADFSDSALSRATK